MDEVSIIATDVQVKSLAAEITRVSRKRPIVVLSIAAGQDHPWIDADQVSQNVGDLADVYVISTIDASWAFAKYMPLDRAVYGGAGRVYPIGTAWLDDKYVSPLRMAFDAREGSKVTQQIISDALNMASISKPVGSLANIGAKRVAAKVEGLIAGQALVRLESGHFATVSPELTLPGIDAENLFQKGQHISGLFHSDVKRLDVTESLVSADEALAHYEIGDVVTTSVTYVDENKVRLMLYPQTVDEAVTVKVTKDLVTGNDLDDLRDLMAVGDVVAARVISLSPSWSLALLDLDDDEPVVSAPSLLPEGPPWIILPEFELPLPDSAESEVTVTSPSELPVTESVPQVQLHGRKLTEQLLLAIESKKAVESDLRAQVTTLGALLEQTESERDALRDQLRETEKRANNAETDLRRLRSQLRKSKTTKSSVREMPEFADSEVGFRHLIQTQWAFRFPLGEQLNRPLPQYAIGSKFLGSVKQLSGISVEKIADVVVEVLTGLAIELEGRSVHPLRENESASAAPVVRSDGAVCWRANLQVGTPQARRLHYWILPNSSIELSRVTLHDDFNP